MNSNTPFAFHRRRLAALSDAAGLWHRCDRAACRRAGACKGAADIIPACSPAAISVVCESVRECLASIPGTPPRPPSRAQRSADATWEIIERSDALLLNILRGMERKVERKQAMRAGGQSAP